MIKFYLKNIKWWTYPKTEKLIAENVKAIKVAKSLNIKRARKVLLPKEEEGTIWNRLVMVDKQSQFSERKQRQQKKLL